MALQLACPAAAGRGHRQGIYPSTVTTSLVPSDCTLIPPWPMFRLLAVNHHPVGVLFPPSTLKPFVFQLFFASPTYLTQAWSTRSQVPSSSHRSLWPFAFVLLATLIPRYTLRRSLLQPLLKRDKNCRIPDTRRYPISDMCGAELRADSFGGGGKHPADHHFKTLLATFTPY